MTGIIGKAQLAEAYGPGMSPSGALNRLHEWLHHSPKLMAALEATGYRDRQKTFSPKQVQIIYDFLGEP